MGNDSSRNESVGAGLWTTIKSLKVKFPKAECITTTDFAAKLTTESCDENLVIMVS